MGCMRYKFKFLSERCWFRSFYYLRLTDIQLNKSLVYPKYSVIAVLRPNDSYIFQEN